MSAPAPAPVHIPGRLNPLAPSAPLPIATLSELATSHDAIVQKETRDKAILSQLITPSRANIRADLLKWTARGFPANFTILSLNVNPPPMCADGVTRSFVDYVQYLLGMTIAAQLVLLQPQLEGIVLSYTINLNNLLVQVSNS